MKQQEEMQNIKEIIQKEIQSIENLEERSVFKELMEHVFLSLYETNQKMYENLEQRIEKELDYDKSRYAVKVGIMEKKFFDVSHHLFFPILESDTEPIIYQMKEIFQTVSEHRAFVLMKVLLCCDFLEQQKLLKMQPEFDAILETEEPKKEWKIKVKLKENREYVQKIAQLYALFLRNGIEWRTVNAPYLYKMADIVITELPEGLNGTEKIKQVVILFEEYAKVIQKDVIPVWNIQKLKLDSIGFPMPCKDTLNYEHLVSLHKYGTQHAYLAEDDKHIKSVHQDDEKLRIVCQISETKKWEIYQIRSSQKQKIDYETFPVMTNQRKDSFAEKCLQKWKQHIKTKTELAHFIKGFELEDYVCYEDCQILDCFEHQKETYEVNFFIEDEIRQKAAQKKLVLYFRHGEKQTWLQRDILSFLVSEVQRIYPEYDCGGILV